MHTGKGQVLELILEEGRPQARLLCPPDLIPAPGQFVLAGDGSDAPLPVPLFYTDYAPRGFIAAAPLPASWNPGLALLLRGPLGRGFTLPAAARKVGLIAMGGSPARLRGLVRPALAQGAALVLVAESSPESLPDAVEVQPPSALAEVIAWADYLAVDVNRAALDQLRESLGSHRSAAVPRAQVLVHTSMPCGGVAECGVCAVTLRSAWKLACREGPVFDWSD